MNYTELKQAVNEVIKANGNEEITGLIMQNVLNSIISSLGKYRTFAGAATPATSPGIEDGNIFYIATQNGVYPNFGGINVDIQNRGLSIFVNGTSGYVEILIPLGLSNMATKEYLDNNFTKLVDFMYIKSKADYLLPDLSTNVSSPNSVGIVKIDNTIDSTFVNWKNIKDRAVTPGTKVRYVGVPPLNTSNDMVAMVGKRSNGTIITLIPAQSTQNTLDTTITLPIDVVSVSANFRATSGDPLQLYSIVSSQTIVKTKVEGLSGLDTAFKSLLSSSGVADISQPLVQGVTLSDGTLNNTDYVNWRTTRAKTVVPGSVIRYNAYAPNSDTTLAGGLKIHAIIGKKSDNSFVTVLANTGGINYVDTFVTIPNDVVEIYATYRFTTGDPILLMLVDTNEIIAQSKIIGLSKFVTDINSLTKRIYTQIADITEPLVVGVLNPDNTIDSSFSNWRVAHNRTVVPGNYVRYRGVTPLGTNPTGNALLGIKETGELVTLIRKNTSALIDEMVVIPDGVTKVSASFRALAGDPMLLTTLSEQIKVDGTKVEGFPKVTKDGYYNSCGTSITQQDGTVVGGVTLKGYQTYLQEIVTFTGYRNYGLSGHSWAVNPINSNSIVTKMSGWQAAKYWTLEGATNDYRLDVVIGTPDDYLNNTGNATLYGSMRIVVDKIYSLSNDAIMCFITDSHRDNSGFSTYVPNNIGNYLDDYNEVFRWVAKRTASPLADVFNESGINENNLMQYTRDGLHPNNDGYKLYARPVITIFRDL